MQTTSVAELRKTLISTDEKQIEFLFDPANMELIEKTCDQLGWTVVSRHASVTYGVVFARLMSKWDDAREVRAFVSELADFSQIQFRVKQERERKMKEGIENLKALEEGTLVMAVEHGETNYYLKTADERKDQWMKMGYENTVTSSEIQRESEGRWAVVKVPVIEE